jgi:hypothetical protein
MQALNLLLTLDACIAPDLQGEAYGAKHMMRQHDDVA